MKLQETNSKSDLKYFALRHVAIYGYIYRPYKQIQAMQPCGYKVPTLGSLHKKVFAFFWMKRLWGEQLLTGFQRTHYLCCALGELCSASRPGTCTIYIQPWGLALGPCICLHMFMQAVSFNPLFNEREKTGARPSGEEDLIVPQDLALNRPFPLFLWKMQTEKANEFLTLVCGLGERCLLIRRGNLEHLTPLYGVIWSGVDPTGWILQATGVITQCLLLAVGSLGKVI